MKRKLLQPQWLGWLLLASLWAVACFFLGVWQWNRWEEKDQQQSLVGRNYDAHPVDIATVLPHPNQPLPSGLRWKMVNLTGEYVPKSEYFVRNRPLHERAGYESLVLFHAENGTNFAVSRGWVKAGENGRIPDNTPPVPAGRIALTGWLLPSEGRYNRDPVPQQLASISTQEYSEAIGKKMATPYVRMRSEKGAAHLPQDRPLPLGKPDLGMAAGINLSYALQWWLGMIAGYTFVIMRARREFIDEEIAAGRRQAKVAKTRIWDEEDE